jgi:CubicO group peptidase (beta-lactamase class C family)/D-alanyl-D-alanine dipeptidase
MGLLIKGRRSRWLACVLATCVLAACTSGERKGEDRAAAAGKPGADALVLQTLLSGYIEREMADKDIPALSIALVDGQRTVWARGFGMADPQRGIAADARTQYRVGSVSKLFTDIALMQQVEQGKASLDEPVARLVPGFHPQGAGAADITLRQLMGHRAGLVREPPVGNYFDAGSPSLEATAASLNRTTLVFPPGTHTKYSNAGVAVVGLAVQNAVGQTLPDYVRQHILDPLGMDDSAFAPPFAPRLAQARMWTLDGRQSPAPRFALGAGPAGELQSSADDMARFIAMLLAGGMAPDGAQVLEPKTLQAMWQPLVRDAPCASLCFGVGFMLSQLDGHRQVGHGGAIYGYSTQLSVLPDDGLGVVVLASKDVVNPVVERIADVALRLALTQRRGDGAAMRAAIPPPTQPVGRAQAMALEGCYRADDGAQVELERNASELELLDLAGGEPQRLRLAGPDRLVSDGSLGMDRAFGIKAGDLIEGDRRYRRQPERPPAPAPAALLGLLGEYGWDHNVLYVFEKDGGLWVLVEWTEYAPMRAVPGQVDTFAFPVDSGMYRGETIRFERDASGRAVRAIMAGVDFPRRTVGPEDGAPQLFVKPLRPVAELLAQAQQQSPPAEPGPHLASDLVEVARLAPGVHLDVRYAGTNNFLRSRFYDQPRVFLQRPAAEALVRAHRALAAQGYGLLLHDGYRPWFVTKVFWDATPDAQKEFVADPAQGSRHNRGAAIDLSLYDLRTGKPVDMVGTYDETTARSYSIYPGGTSLQRWHRQLLRDAMEAQGFTVLVNEWWHFDYAGGERYPIGNASFETLERGERDGKE